MLEKLKRGTAWCLEILLALVQWAVLLVVRVALIIVGLPVVAVAILFAVPGFSLSDGRPIWNLPGWAWLFGNDFDGLDGDKRRWWADNCDDLVLFGLLPLLRRLGFTVDWLAADSWLARWWWAAVRNPVNNLRLVPGFNCPVSECEIRYLGDYAVEDKPGQGGWQFVSARRRGGVSRWYGFYLALPYGPSRAFVVRLGYKVKPAHQDTAEPGKGMTFKINPAKAI
ncbi:TPA: DUF7338 family protein [Pseudomonas aeruginosa]